MPKQTTRIAVVVNPQTLSGATAIAWECAADRLRQETEVCAQWRTRGEQGDVQQVVDLIRAQEPDVIVAAGGDGTVSEVVRAIVSSPRRPALAILPLGTANNVARSFGLSSFRQYGKAAADQAVGAIVHGRERRIDLGTVDGRPFVGAFAIGMDADILCMRNRLRRRFGLGREIGGYPLYLYSCFINVFRTHGGAAELTVNGNARRVRFYNLLVTNTPIYAGEFRFVTEDTADDGRLDLHLFAGATDYLRRYPAAWLRHLRHERGWELARISHQLSTASADEHASQGRTPSGLLDVLSSTPSSASVRAALICTPLHALATKPGEICGLEVSESAVEHVRDLVIETDEPMSAQLDGEELEAAARFVVRVLPAGLAVKVPVPASR